MNRLNKLTALAAAVALSGGLAACGGGGSSTSMMPEQTPQEACEAADGRWNADMTCSSAEEVQIEMLQGQIAALRTQLGLEPADDLGDSITELQNMVTNLQNQVNEMKEEADTAEKKAAAAEALALFNSFSDNAGDTTNPDVVTVNVTAVSDSDDGGGSARITADPVGGTPTADGDAVGPGLGGDDVVRTAYAMLDDWQGTMLSDADTAGNSTTALVYTDVGPNTSKGFAAVYGGVDATTVAALLTGTGLPTGFSGNANAAIVSSKFSSSGLKDHHGDRNMTSNVVTVDGTFDGARGSYTCTSAAAGDCTSNMTADGVVLGGAWSFNPVDTAMVSQPDANYAYFGWWLNKTAAGSPEVDVFHGSNHPVETGAGATAFDALGGTATYEGEAVGKYAMNRGADQYASGGHWTADATLTASFEGGSADGVAGPGTISGMIDGFMAGGEMMDWSVELRSTNIAIADGDDFSMATAGTIWTVGGAKAAAGGAWSGAFHNQTAPADGGNNVPGTVTGEFTSVYGAVGHMTGAFGAHVDE